MKIKTGDSVKVISGHYKGTVGEVKAVDPKKNTVIVEGVNKVRVGDVVRVVDVTTTLGKAQ